MDRKFPLGQVLSTPGALDALARAGQEPWSFIGRHVAGDWGELDEEDRRENELSLKEGFRILSAYTLSDGTRIWIFTEADRSATTLLLPSEYLVPRDTAGAGKDFARGCDLGVAQSCRSLVALVQKEGPDVFAPGCNHGDGESCFVLGSLAHAGSGVPKDPARAMALFSQACSSGWPRGCGALGEYYRAGNDTSRAVEFFEKACRAGIAPSCYAVATIYRSRNDELLAQQRFRQACESSTRFAATNAAYFKSGAVSTTPNAAICSQSNPQSSPSHPRSRNIDSRKNCAR